MTTTRSLQGQLVPAAEVAGVTAPVAEHLPPAGVRHGVGLVVALGGLSAFGPLSLDMYLPALPTISAELHAGTASVQLTLTACLAGLALGQLVAGPLSDVVGRRRPLLVGVAGYVLASVLCAIAPTLPLLLAARLAQGMCGSAGIVVARAVVRDLYDGAGAARYFARLMLVTGLAPILAPVLGAQLLPLTGWRGVFGVLAGLGLLLLAAVVLLVPETWPPERRTGRGVRASLGSTARLTGDRVLLGYALTCGLAFAAMFTYISSSSFVVQDVYGASPQLFSGVFALNAVGLVTAGQLSGRAVGRVGPSRLLAVGVAAQAVGAVALLAVVLAHPRGLGLFVVPLFVVVAAVGFVTPNATALALARHARQAGAASALLGVLQYVIGAAAAPLAGLSGPHTALPMVAVMAALAVGALGLLVATGRAVRAAA